MVQTFVPFPDFAASAAALDDRRLGKQRVEVLQILRALHLDSYGWAAHPAVRMWQGHTAALVGYGIAVVDEWCARGHDDTTRSSIVEFIHPDPPRAEPVLAQHGLLPPWWGRPEIHRSHRAALLRKDPVHYAAVLPETDEALEYVWPEPPAPRPSPGPVDAWVVRGHAGPDRVSFAAHAGEGRAALDGGGRSTKRVRGVRRFAFGLQPGDAVVVPVKVAPENAVSGSAVSGSAEILRIGVIQGAYRRVVARHVRPVHWVGQVPRRALRFPAAMQDPQVVFPLHDEPAVRQACSRSG